MAEGVNLGSAYGTIRIDVARLLTDLKGGSEALRTFQADSERSAAAATKSFSSTKEGAKALGKALGAVAAAGSALLVSATLTAARTQVLGTVLHQVGKNAGYSAAALDVQVEKIKKLGITTQEARTALVRFMQSELDVADAAKLARAAQDLAVIAGQNSSQAYQTLTQAIVAQETTLLRQYGIVKGLTEIYGAYAAKHKLVASALDETQKKQAFLDAILESGAAAAGTYEAAMGDVGKQLTSLPRYTEEAKNALGEGLLPVMGLVVGAVTGLLKGFINLEPGMKAGVSTAAAMGTAIATIGSSALIAGPKIAEMVSKIATLGTATLGVVGAAALIVTAVVSLVAASEAAQAAHRRESGEAAASSETYSQYRRRLDEAGASAYALSEALYNLVRAQDASRQAAFAEELLKEKDALEYVLGIALRSSTGYDNLFKSASQARLAVLQDRDAVMQLGTALGLSGKNLLAYVEGINQWAAEEAKRRVDLANEIELERTRAQTLTDMMQTEEKATAIVSDHGAAMRKLSDDYMEAQRSAVELARETGLSVEKVKELRDQAGYTGDEIRNYADDMRITGKEAEDLAESTGLTVEEVRRLNSEAGMGQADIEAYAQALKDAKEQQLDLIGAWSDGLTGLTDFQEQVAETAKDYKAKLADLKSDTSSKLSDINKKWQNALPDPTSVADRMKQTSEAWDEWALRIQGAINDVGAGVNSEWVAVLQRMGYITATDTQGIVEQLKTLKKQFYEGKLPDLINKNAPEWKEWSATVAAEQKKATDAVNAEAASRRAALDKERQEELAAQKAHYNDMMVQTALHIAEESGALATWAQQTQAGPSIEFYSNADAVFEAIKSGMLEIDPILAQLIGTTIPGLGAAFEDAKKTAEGNKITLDDVMDPDFLSNLETTKGQINTALLNLGSVTTMGPGKPETGMEGGDWIDEVMGLKDIPDKAETAFGAGGLSGKFTTATDSMGAGAKVMASTVKTAITAIPTEAKPQLTLLSDEWTTTVNTMLSKATLFKDEVIAKLREIVNYVNGMTVSASISWSAAGGFAAGGMVPGPTGAPVAATVHGGEMILNPGQQATLARMFGVSQSDIIRNVFGHGGGGGSGAAAGRQVHTEFHQHFGDVIVRKPSDAREFGMDFSYGAQYRLRAVGLLG